MTCIHAFWPCDSRPVRPHDLRLSIQDGDVSEVAHALARKDASFGHEVSEMGGDWTRGDGIPKALWFTVTVHSDRHEPMTWWHMVTEPGEVWPLDPPDPSRTATEQPDDTHDTQEGR